MSLVATSQAAPRRIGPSRATVLIWLIAGTLYTAVGLHLASNQFVSPDLASLWAARGTTSDGVWLSSLLIEALHWLPEVLAQWLLSLVSAVAAGLGLALLFVNLRRNDWSMGQAATLLALLGCNALILYAVTAANSAIPLIFACALMIPSIRRLESVGDVQAEMGFGLVLSLFLLAGPETAPLVPILAAMSAFSDPRARRDWRAFIAMFLVAILPSLIVLAGLLVVNYQGDHTLADFVAPFAAAYARDSSSNWFDALLSMVLLAPVAALPILYCLLPDRRMKPLSALAVIGLPLYLALARAVLGWEVAPWAPAAALLGAFCAWLAASRMRVGIRLAALALMALSAALSWAYADRWAEAQWVQALRGSGSTSLQSCRQGSVLVDTCDGLRGRVSAALTERRTA